MNSAGRSLCRTLAERRAPAAALCQSKGLHVAGLSNRGGPACTSGRQHAEGRRGTVPPLARAVQQDAAAVQHGLDLSSSGMEPPLTPRRIMNRRIKSCLSLAQLSNLVLSEVDSFDSVNSSHALARVAKMYNARYTNLAQTNLLSGEEQEQARRELQPAIDALSHRMTQLINNYDAWSITNSLWALAQLGHHSEPVLQTLCDAGLQSCSLFKPADCANAVTACATLGFVHQELLRQIVTTSTYTIDDFQPSEVAQVLWGYAKLGAHPGNSFLTDMLEAVHWRMDQYATQELVMVMWSLVRLGFKPGPRFLVDAQRTLLGRLHLLAPVDVSVAAWAFAKLRFKAVRFLDEAPALVLPALREYKNEEVCELLCGYATARHYHKVLLDGVAGAVLQRLDSFSHWEVCQVLWAYGAFRHRPPQPEFAKQMAAQLYERMPHFTPQGLAMVAKALAQLQWRSGPLLLELCNAAEANISGFKPLELSQLLWGLSTLDCRELGIYYSAVRRCIAMLKDPTHPHHRTMRNHKVINSVLASCQQVGYVPWVLVDFAESRGLRVRQPGNLSSRDEEDEGVPMMPGAAAAAAAGGDAGGDEEAEAGGDRDREAARGHEAHVPTGAAAQAAAEVLGARSDAHPANGAAVVGSSGAGGAAAAARRLNGHAPPRTPLRFDELDADFVEQPWDGRAAGGAHLADSHAPEEGQLDLEEAARRLTPPPPPPARLTVAPVPLKGTPRPHGAAGEDAQWAARRAPQQLPGGPNGVHGPVAQAGAAAGATHGSGAAGRGLNGHASLHAEEDVAVDDCELPLQQQGVQLPPHSPLNGRWAAGGAEVGSGSNGAASAMTAIGVVAPGSDVLGIDGRGPTGQMPLTSGHAR